MSWRLSSPVGLKSLIVFIVCKQIQGIQKFRNSCGFCVTITLYKLLKERQNVVFSYPASILPWGYQTLSYSRSNLWKNQRSHPICAASPKERKRIRDKTLIHLNRIIYQRIHKSIKLDECMCLSVTYFIIVNDICCDITTIAIISATDLSFGSCLSKNKCDLFFYYSLLEFSP